MVIQSIFKYQLVLLFMASMPLDSVDGQEGLAVSKPSLAEKVHELILEDGAKVALRGLPELIDSGRYDLSEAEMNQVAYALYQVGRKQDALLVLKSNDTLFQDSPRSLAARLFHTALAEGAGAAREKNKSFQSSRNIYANRGSLRIGDTEFFARSSDVFVRADGKQMAYFTRDLSNRIRSFSYSTSDDAFERVDEFPQSP